MLERQLIWRRVSTAELVSQQAKEIEEQCRLNAMGSEREARLMGEVERLKKELALLHGR
jgi:hypothetical protein